MWASAYSEYGGPEVLHWQELADLVPGPGEVLIDVHACGVNHADLDSRAGLSPWEFPMPHVLGGEVAGRIAALGSAVEGWEVGQEVTAVHQFSCGHCERCFRWRPDLCPEYKMMGTDTWGGYGEQVVLPARLLIALDAEEQMVTAASSLCVVSTAWHMVRKLADVRPGERVLVPSASGGVAGALVQCAKLAGAEVIASVGSAEKAAGVEALGADHVFVHREVAPGDAVAELTGGAGVDAVLDTTGGPRFNEHLGCLRVDGRLAICGAHAGEREEVDLISIFVRGLRILGFRMASPDDIVEGLRLTLDGAVTVPIARTFLQSEAAEAHRYLDRREHVGKVMLVRDKES